MVAVGGATMPPCCWDRGGNPGGRESPGPPEISCSNLRRNKFQKKNYKFFSIDGAADI